MNRNDAVSHVLGWNSFLILATLLSFSGCENTKKPASPTTQVSSDTVAGGSTPEDIDSIPTSTNEQVESNSEPEAVDDVSSSVVRRGKVAKLKLTRPIKASEQEAEKIRELIRKLATIDSPDFGMSSTMSGDAFLPIDDQSQVDSFLFTNHDLKSSAELRKLVQLGPKSLPFLLSALDDETPTQLTMTHDGQFGVMWFANELWGNPINPTEQRVISKIPKIGMDDEKHVDSYTVKVGDVCLVAIGQIVGRSYSTVRYQPTACIVINSPTHDAGLCEQVREIWGGGDAAQKLLDSFLLDYATEGIFNGHSLDGWGVGNSLQTSAAMRLLYYFPQESAELIAARLDQLDVEATGPGSGSESSQEELEAYMKQCVANGVRADDFVNAVAWCREPKVVAAVSRVFDRATDPDVEAAALRGVGSGDPERVRARLAVMIDKLPAEESGPFGDGYNLLIALGQYGGEEAKPVFQKYLETRTVQRCRSMCHALRKVHGDWAVELLEPLLDDQQDADGWTYAVEPDRNEPRLPIRVCDEAAETIAAADKDHSFSMQGTHADLDRQIKAIQQVLSKRRE